MSVYDKYSEAQIVELKNLFLRSFERKGLFHRSAELAGLSKSEIDKLLADDKAFAEDFKIAQEKFTESLEAVAHTKALEGESDTLLQFLLRANKPEKYNPSSGLGVAGSAGSRVLLMFSDGELTDEERKLLNPVDLEEIKDE